MGARIAILIFQRLTNMSIPDAPPHPLLKLTIPLVLDAKLTSIMQWALPQACRLSINFTVVAVNLVTAWANTHTWMLPLDSTATS